MEKQKQIKIESPTGISSSELNFSYSGLDKENIVFSNHVEVLSTQEDIIVRFFVQRVIPNEAIEKKVGDDDIIIKTGMMKFFDFRLQSSVAINPQTAMRLYNALKQYLASNNFIDIESNTQKDKGV
jgi:hypothetical protein